VVGPDGSQPAQAAVGRGFAVDGLRHDERLAGRLQVAHDGGVLEAAIHQQNADIDAGGAHPPSQFADDLRRRGPAPDPDQGEGKALAVAHQIGGRVGVEVRGPALGLAAIDLEGVLKRLAVVWDQGQVAGDRPPAAADGPRQMAGERQPEAAVEFLRVGELSGQVEEDGVAVRGIHQAATGIGQGRQPLGGEGQDGTDDAGGTAADRGPGTEHGGEPGAKQLLHLRGGQDRLTGSHG
jgi:hypothetical protein